MRPLYLRCLRSDQVVGTSSPFTLSLRIGMPTIESRWAIHRPSRSRASSTTLSKPSGRNGSNRPCFARPFAAPASDMVITSAPGRPALTSCCRRRSTAWPPVRRSCTLIPVCCWNLSASCCASATGVDVYQLTVASLRAASASALSGACADAAPRPKAETNPKATANLVRDPIAVPPIGDIRVDDRRCRHALPAGAKRQSPTRSQRATAGAAATAHRFLSA